MPEPFVFAIPLKPKAASSAWEAAERNLRRTVVSARASAGPAGALIVIAGHDLPDLGDADGPDVRLLEVPFAPPAAASEGSRDKSRKRRFIGAWLRESLPASSCVMFLDADDLVHRDLVEFARSTSAPSYLIDDGYIFDARVGILHRYRHHFHRTCGSTFLCRFARDELPTSWEDDACPFGQFGSSPEQRGHQDYDLVASELGKTPVVVPFPASIYYANHDESLWASKKRPARRASDPRSIVAAGRSRRILAEEFNAGDLGQEPARIRVALSYVQASVAFAAARLLP